MPPKPAAGVIAWRHPYNYEMALGFENANDVVPGLVTDDFNEQNQRGMYKRWRAFMEAASWRDLAPKGRR